MDDLTLADLFVGALAIFFVGAFLWLFITLLADLIRSHDLSGWGKAAWAVGLILFPLLGSLFYIVVRGGGLPARYLAASGISLDSDGAPVRATASPADELQRVVDLRDRGVLTDDEFIYLKGRVLQP